MYVLRRWALPTRELLTYAVMFNHKHTASWQKLLQHSQSCHQPHLLTRYVTNSATFLYFLIDMIWNSLQITRAEVKIATLLVHSNVPFSVANQLSPLFKEIFPDSRIAAGYASKSTKTTCIVNGALKPYFRSKLVAEMKEKPYSIAIDGSNDTGLLKMNPLSLRHVHCKSQPQ